MNTRVCGHSGAKLDALHQTQNSLSSHKRVASIGRKTLFACTIERMRRVTEHPFQTARDRPETPMQRPYLGHDARHRAGAPRATGGAPSRRNVRRTVATFAPFSASDIARALWDRPGALAARSRRNSMICFVLERFVFVVGLFRRRTQPCNESAFEVHVATCGTARDATKKAQQCWAFLESLAAGG